MKKEKVTELYLLDEDVGRVKQQDYDDPTMVVMGEEERKGVRDMLVDSAADVREEEVVAVDDDDDCLADPLCVGGSNDEGRQRGGGGDTFRRLSKLTGGGPKHALRGSEGGGGEEGDGATSERPVKVRRRRRRERREEEKKEKEEELVFSMTREGDVTLTAGGKVYGVVEGAGRWRRRGWGWMASQPAAAGETLDVGRPTKGESLSGWAADGPDPPPTTHARSTDARSRHARRGDFVEEEDKSGGEKASANDVRDPWPHVSAYFRCRFLRPVSGRA